MQAVVLPLWPGDAPGSAGLNLVEEYEERSEDVALYRDRALTGIARPSLRVYQPTSPNGLAILLVPGGGYRRIVIDKEGEEIARWLLGLGITVFQLKYRLPAEGHAQAADVTLQDGQRAMRLIRSQALRFGIAPSRVGVMGFSAGGHLAAMLGTRFAAPVYTPVDAIDGNSARPDFMLLAYPVITMEATFAHPGTREKLLGEAPTAAQVKACSGEFCVTPDTPPCFLLHADDDESVPAENSLRFYFALRRQRVKAELHVYQQGGHGFGIRLAKGPVRDWTALCENWLRLNRWLT